ncbi:MAG: hypothetical protein PHH65_01515, partial [Eubacteriales bacterium]|nr:hypothetical protein [Eubacteriales bacterium]
MRTRKNTIYLTATSILTVLLLHFFDQGIALSYISKIGLKIALFVIVPAVYTMWTGENVFKTSISNRRARDE